MQISLHFKPSSLLQISASVLYNASFAEQHGPDPKTKQCNVDVKSGSTTHQPNNQPGVFGVFSCLLPIKDLKFLQQSFHSWWWTNVNIVKIMLSYSNIFGRNIFAVEYFCWKFRCLMLVWRGRSGLISELISYKIATLEQSFEDKRMLKVWEGRYSPDKLSRLTHQSGKISVIKMVPFFQI